MKRSGRDYSWLPEHQLHSVLTLAHADDLVGRVGDLLFGYLNLPDRSSLGMSPMHSWLT